MKKQSIRGYRFILKIRKLLEIFIVYILFIILVYIHSFANIVSDTDGTAFVTKSEFELMKKNFSNQINKYNDSLDSKIEGAIAEYLSGKSKSSSELVKLLSAGKDEVGYFEDEDMCYQYVTPEWHCSLYGTSSTFGKGSQYGLGGGVIYTLSSDINVSDSSYGSKELVLEKSIDAIVGLDWVWKGYYTNVKWKINTTSETAVPSDANFNNISWAKSHGPFFSLPAGYYDLGYKENIDFRKCVLWVYSNTNSPSTKDGIAIGPIECTATNTKSIVNTVAVEYKDDDRLLGGSDDNKKCWSRYIIGFKNYKKECNIYSDVRYIGAGKDSDTNLVLTESYNSFANKTVFRGMATGFWTTGTTAGPNFTGYNCNWEKYSAIDGEYKGVTKITNDEIPILGGLGKILVKILGKNIMI